MTCMGSEIVDVKRKCENVKEVSELDQNIHWYCFDYDASVRIWEKNRSECLSVIVCSEFFFAIK